jgi:hypothetical protein
VRNVLKAYFDKKARVAALKQQQNAVTQKLASAFGVNLPEWGRRFRLPTQSALNLPAVRQN